MEYQIIILTLSDGRKITAVVPAFSKPDEPLWIASVQLTEPRALPPGLTFGQLRDLLTEEPKTP